MMLIYLGADHRGFKLKEALKYYLKEQGYEVADLGNIVYDKGDDFPDFAAKVAKEVGLAPEQTKGILICGSGTGMAIVANKFKNVRAGLAMSPDQAHTCRHDDNINVLSLAADFTSEDDAKNIVRVFLATPFGDEERYRRRIEKISQIENQND
jgi:ribose 5-phosphate isomerase B